MERSFIPSESSGTSTTTVAEELDLRGIRCPLSWARAKVHLESIADGGLVRLWVDEAKGARDLPRAAEAEGFAVLEVVEQSGSWRILIEK